MGNESDRQLAVYATRSQASVRRAHAEPADPLRGPFELDRHRIVGSTAFRRLEHKTQVFAAAHHDHFRTRLTHTLEAAYVARTLARGLCADEALSEAITLAHDLGHPPFGHAGETALAEAMAAHGGFNHNLHALRVVEYLEHPYPAFRGLNLTAATLAGLATHATRYDTPDTSPDGRNRDRPAGPSVEAQVASLADRLAYNCHDLEDAIGAGFIGLNELREVRIWREAFEQPPHLPRGDKGGFPASAPTSPGPSLPTSGAGPVAPNARGAPANIHALRRAVLDAILDRLLADAVSTSRALLAPVLSEEAARLASAPLVRLSEESDGRLAELEVFLVEHVYSHAEVSEMDARGREMVSALFDAYRKNPAALPERFAARIDEQGLEPVICDYIAGMTDRYCEAAHARLVGQS